MTLHVREGQFTAVLGAPGSGKSTLLQHMNGLLVADQGRVRVRDVEIIPGERKSVPPRLRKTAGLVFQYPEQQLFEETVERELCFGPLNFGAGEAEAKAAARQAAALMHIDDRLLPRSPFELSSGQMRKCAIAAVLASEPDILVLDEPTAAMDPISRKELLELLSGLCRNQRKTIIMVTHRLEEVLDYADEYVVLETGKTIFQGDADSLLDRPDILARAGIALPKPVRLAEALSAQFGTDKPGGACRSVAAMAGWIEQLMEG